MTAETRSDRELPAILEDLYLGPSPDYRDEVMAAAARVRQRPSWTFAGRWFPMADITRPALAPRVPWRAIGATLIVVALILAAAAILATGSRQTKVPPPFGPARNGLITYAADGDIFSVDPVTGMSTGVTHGPALDQDPVFSPDGTQIAFGRGEDIVVVEPNGAGERVITAVPIPGGPRGLAWAPDSKSLLVSAPDGSALWLFDATGAAEPRVIPTNASPYGEPFRPPDGKQILASRGDPTGEQIVVVDVATGDETVLAKGGREYDYRGARWSPDGSKIVFNGAPLDDIGTERLFEIRPDGTGLRQLTHEPGLWLEFDPVWSPDGSRIAFARYGHGTAQPVGILEIATGSVRGVGPLPTEVRAQHAATGNAFATTDENFEVAWSPDGTMLMAFGRDASGHPVLINAVDGTWSVIDDEADTNSIAGTWQRKAP